MLTMLNNISNLDNRTRRVVLPEEALVKVKILEASDPPDLVRIAVMNGQEFLVSTWKDESFEVGEEREVFLEFNSKEFGIVRSLLDDELGIWPVSEHEGRVGGYRYAGRIGGMYDWHVEAGYRGPSLIGLIVLLDVGFLMPVRFEFDSLAAEKAYFGFSDFVTGKGWFSISDASMIRNHVRYVKGPPWRMRSTEFRFIEDESHWHPSPPPPSKARRKAIRRKARTEDSKSANTRIPDDGGKKDS